MEARITELESEKLEMIREHENALINAADRISAAERKIDKLEKPQELESIDPVAPPGQIYSLRTGKKQKNCESDIVKKARKRRHVF